MPKDEDIALRFGERVRKLRIARGLSQEAFAHQCGLDRTYVSGIERGKRNLAIRNVEAIAKAFRVSLSELMRGL